MAVLASITVLASAPAHAASQPGTTASCPAATTTDAGCALAISAPASAGSGTSPVAPVSATVPSGLSPSDLQQAYNLQGSMSGSGQTVAVVTPYDDPSAASDLAAYRSQYGLSPCTVADGCFKQVSQTGTSTLPPTSANWDATEAASIEVVSAICPNCHITVVEATSTAIADLGAAENEAASLGAKFIDNDWYIYESSTETTYDTQYFNHPGVAITAPSGDDTGYGVTYPAASQYVTAVGGTLLTAGSDSGTWTETVWPNSGSGCSEYEPKPSWQTDTGCTTRTLNDLSADAGGPVAFYDTPTEAGWGTVTGTAVSAAIIAATYALAGTPGAGDYPAEYPYEHPGGSYTTPGNAYTSTTGLFNGTTGSNGTCSVTYLCTAGTGYSGPIGLGTPSGDLSLSSTGSSPAAAFYSGITGKCLDDNGDSATAGTKADIYDCNGSTAQHWQANSDGTISVTGTGNVTMCLDVAGGATASGSLVIVSNCGNSSGTWTEEGNGKIVNAASGMCLDDPGFATANGTQLDIWPCDDGTNQQWTIPYSRRASTGYMKTKISSSKCVADNSDVTTNGNPITINDCLGNNAQYWDLTSTATFQLHGQSGCITPDGDGMVNATKLVYHTCDGDPSQVWIEHSDGSLVNVRSGLCFADPGADTTNGLQLQLSPCNSQIQQTWNMP